MQARYAQASTPVGAARRVRKWYSERMSAKDEPPAEWIEALRRSDADLAAGRTVPASVVLAELRETIEQMEAERDRVPHER